MSEILFAAANEYACIQNKQISTAFDSIDNSTYGIQLCNDYITIGTKSKMSNFARSCFELGESTIWCKKGRIHHFNCAQISINLHNSHYLYYY